MRTLAIAVAVVASIASPAMAQTCVFTTVGTTMVLQGDCTTSSSILIPDGGTLDGNGYTVTAVDPASDHFRGAVIRNAGTSAGVLNVTVTTLDLTNACDAGADRLRGIMFEGAAGVIAGNTVINLNQGPSGCQEGNAIEVRNDPFDGTGTNPLVVEVAQNTVSNYQKTGIVANGNVDVSIHHNNVGASATQANLAANSIQIGFGAKGTVTNNHVSGNSWTTNTSWASSAILLYQAASGTLVRHNNLMDGNADVGIWIEADGVTVDNNRVFESGADGAYDFGVGDWGTGNAVTNNKVRGYEYAYDGVTTGNNKAIPSPHDQ